MSLQPADAPAKPDDAVVIGVAAKDDRAGSTLPPLPE